MKIIKGQYNSAKIFTDELEQEADYQIRKFLDHPAFEGTNIAIMPDVHSGKGSVIGFTMNMNDYIIPNIIGVDIGCGVLAVKLGRTDVSYQHLDKFINQEIPSGFDINRNPSELLEEEFIYQTGHVSKKLDLPHDKVLKAVGSLGGGNHYIEIDKDRETGDLWLVIHSGSRNFGLQVANYHQKKAIQYCEKKKIMMNRDLCYLPLNDGGNDYIDDMKVAQQFAHLNRFILAHRITEFLGFKLKKLESFESVHNYINFEDKIIRKGAIAAGKGRKVIIPFNMRDGAMIATGKGNKEWNFSAPHGAGRLMSRTKAFKAINLEEYKKSMEGIYSSSVNKKTIDESPFAYKNYESILKYITDTVEDGVMIKPVYNFKAAE